jgi:hypothetical protein
MLQKMKILQKYGYSGLEVDQDFLFTDLYKKADSPNLDAILVMFEIQTSILRGYIFVATFQSFEMRLKQLCEKAKSRHGSLSLNDIYGENTVKRCKDYLTKVARIVIPDDNLWKTISTYNILRNTIIHSNQEIRPGDKAERLIKLANTHPGIEYQKEDLRIIVNEGFCAKAVENFELFLKNIEDQLK